MRASILHPGSFSSQETVDDLDVLQLLYGWMLYTPDDALVRRPKFFATQIQRLEFVIKQYILIDIYHRN